MLLLVLITAELIFFIFEFSFLYSTIQIQHFQNLNRYFLRDEHIISVILVLLIEFYVGNEN